MNSDFIWLTFRSVEVIEQIKSFEEDTKQDEDEFRDEVETANKKRKGINLDDPSSVWKGVIERVGEKKVLRRTMLRALYSFLLVSSQALFGNFETNACHANW